MSDVQRNNVEGAPNTLGPYCHSTTIIDFTFVSGQLGLDPATNQLREGVAEQTTQAMENIRTILANQSISMSDIARCTIYYTQTEDFPVINDAYGAMFENDDYPARVCVQVAGLPAGGLVMIDAIAYKKSNSNDFLKAELLGKGMVLKARDVLTSTVAKTPCVPFEYAEKKKGLNVWLKLENLQITGSFKLRGAYFMMSQMIDKVNQHGVTTYSAGNHAQGVAYAASVFGAHANIFIPDSAPQEKIDSTESLGATVTLVPGDFEAAKAQCEQYAQETGAVLIPPYDNAYVIGGQSTVAVEILEELPDATAIIVPVGGGGLAAGVAFAAKQIKPNIKIYGSQAEAAPSMAESLKAGHPVTVPVSDTLADGIHVARPGDQTFRLIKAYVDDIVTVSEEQIAEAMKLLMTQEKIVVEGASCTTVAALMNDLLPIGPEDKVVCVISGGNVHTNDFAHILM